MGELLHLVLVVLGELLALLLWLGLGGGVERGRRYEGRREEEERKRWEDAWLFFWNLPWMKQRTPQAGGNPRVQEWLYEREKEGGEERGEGE
jgi:hypothetical protein